MISKINVESRTCHFFQPTQIMAKCYLTCHRLHYPLRHPIIVIMVKIVKSYLFVIAAVCYSFMFLLQTKVLFNSRHERLLSSSQPMRRPVVQKSPLRTTKGVEPTTISKTALSTPLRFDPGTLKMAKKDTISKCWTSSPRKQEQRIQSTQNCLYSSQYNVTVNLSGKTGTSTQKRVLGSTMDAEEVPCKSVPQGDGIVRVATVREPLDRFISGYKEVLYRNDIYGEAEEEEIPSEYSRFLQFVQGKSVQEKQDLFQAETPTLLQLKTNMFTTFVEDYDGENVFDRHLNSQTIKLWDPYGSGMAKYNVIMESSNLTSDLADLATLVGAPAYSKDVRARSRVSDRIDMDALPDQTIQKICRLFALDYCCLNYELPKACQRAAIGERVQCEWVHGEDSKSQIRSVLV